MNQTSITQAHNWFSRSRNCFWLDCSTFIAYWDLDLRRKGIGKLLEMTSATPARHATTSTTVTTQTLLLSAVDLMFVVVSVIADNWPHTDWSLADPTTCCFIVICLSIMSIVIQMFKHDVYGKRGDEEIQDTEHSMLVSSNIKQLNAELERAPPSPQSSQSWKTWDHRPNEIQIFKQSLTMSGLHLSNN